MGTQLTREELPSPIATQTTTTAQKLTIRDTVCAWDPARPLGVFAMGAQGTIAGEPHPIVPQPQNISQIEHQTADQPRPDAPDHGRALLAGLPPTTPHPIMVLIPYHAGASIEPTSITRHAPHDRPAWADRSGTVAFSLRDAHLFGEQPEEPGTQLVPQNQETGDTPPDLGYTLTPIAPDLDRAAYTGRIARTLDYIRAGDIYQANIAHRFRGRFAGSPRALFAALLRTASPRYASYMELPDGRVVLSASPELFLAFDAGTRAVRTQPMKGTRVVTSDPDELRHAEKDRAELNMITDLMRNDLGRVCSFGSIRVEEARTIEPHGASVLQATSTVSGTLREDATLRDLLGATFPPGSITGAPKIRAMQIIDELEDHPRGFYCGSIGLITPDGNATFNVAIRTAELSAPDETGGRTLTYHAGGGIVADSDPDEEWEETLLKAEVFRRLATTTREIRS